MSCSHSETIEQPKVFLDGTKHIELLCKTCGNHIKYVSHKTPEDYSFHFGRYKGMKFLDVIKQDRSYAEWIIADGILKRGQLKAFRELFDKNAK